MIEDHLERSLAHESQLAPQVVVRTFADSFSFGIGQDAFEQFSVFAFLLTFLQWLVAEVVPKLKLRPCLFECSTLLERVLTSVIAAIVTVVLAEIIQPKGIWLCLDNEEFSQTLYKLCLEQDLILVVTVLTTLFYFERCKIRVLASPQCSCQAHVAEN